MAWVQNLYIKITELTLRVSDKLEYLYQTTGDKVNLQTQNKQNLVSAINEIHNNKQNSLAPDGTGTKYPTVDAVNAAITAMGGDKTYTYEQLTPSTVWGPIPHGLEKYPNVSLRDSAGTEFQGTIEHLDMNTLLIKHNIPCLGFADIN